MNLRRIFGTGTLLLLSIASIHLLAQDPYRRYRPPHRHPAASAPGTANDPVRLNVSVDLVNVSATVQRLQRTISERLNPG